jgi:hypothetical protein
MSDDRQAQDENGQTAADLRRRTKTANRMVLWLLLGVAGVFLAGAFGVALLVIHGPY